MLLRDLRAKYVLFYNRVHNEFLNRNYAIFRVKFVHVKLHGAQ